MMYLCLSCLNEIPEQGKELCPMCGFSASRYYPPQHWLEGGFVLNHRYYIGMALRSDDYGVSYHAYDLVMQRKVVIRQLMVRSRMPGDPTMLRRDEPFFTLQHAESFYRAYREAADVELSSLPTIYTFGRFGNVLYAVEEYIPGVTLKQYSNEKGPRSFDRTKKLLLPVIIALKLLHSRGVCHGDLTWEHIIKTDKSCLLVDLTGVDTVSDRREEGVEQDSGVYRDIRRFLLIFLSLMFGCEEMLDAGVIDQDFLTRSDLPLPQDVRQYIYSVFHPGEQKADISAQGVLNVVFKAGEIAVGKKNQPIQAIPPRFLQEAAAVSGLQVEKIITSVPG